MGYLRLKDDVIWASHIEGDDQLRERLKSLRSGGLIELEVAGIVGQWEKMKTGKDGRTTTGVKPIGPMRDVWKRFQQRRGEVIPIRETQTADRYLQSLQETLNEWDNPEDDEAFRGL
jgi:hypothetical protein